MKLYIKPHFPLKSVNDVIKCLYWNATANIPKWNANYTYTDENCENIECMGQRRSFDDLLTISRTYFPDTTEVELMSALIGNGIVPMYCDDIRKVVHYRVSGSDYLTHIEYVIRQCKYLPYTEGTYKPERLLEIYNECY